MKLTELRAELNEALYAMIDATSDKRFNAAERRVYQLRQQIKQALWAKVEPYSRGGRMFCDACGEEVDNPFEETLCEWCRAEFEDDEVIEIDYCDS